MASVAGHRRRHEGDTYGKTTALICGTGGGGGIATSLTLAREGVDVVAVDHSQALVDETIRQVTAVGATRHGNPSPQISVSVVRARGYQGSAHAIPLHPDKNLRLSMN